MISKNSLFVDTSGWVYLIDRHDALHHSINALYQTALKQQRTLITTNYILAELVALLASRSRLPRSQIFSFVDALKVAPHVRTIHIDAELDTTAWHLLKARIDKEWSLVDASSFGVMNIYGIQEAISTDHHFTQAGFTRLPQQPS